MAKYGFKIADAYVEVHTDNDGAKEGIKNLPKDVGPEAEKAGRAVGKRVGKGLGDESDRQGRDAGGKLAQGMRLSLVRNSPLIVAAVAGGLIAGAPVMTAAAGALFAGIGIVAAAQNEKVKAAYSGLWNDIKSGTEKDAASLVPILVDVASRLGKTFSDLRPLARDAFTASGPLIEKFTTGIDNLARNSMPGMVRAVQGAGPVFDGLATFMGKVGTGLSDFFDTINAHAPAAGQVMASLGDIVGTLLPMLGDLMGSGSELGAVILPALADVLKVVAGALHLIAPVLPIVVSGLTALKFANTAAGWMNTLSGKLTTAATSGGVFGSSMGRAGAAASSFGRALPVVGTALLVLGTMWGQSNQQIDDWAQALVEGGRTADTATKQLQDAHTRSIADAHGVSDAWGIVKGAFADGAAQLQGYSSAEDKASSEAKKMIAAMSPMEQLQRKQKIALGELNQALEDHGTHSGQAQHAADNYKIASDRVTRAQEEEERAIRGVTSAMVAQADQEDARANSSIAYRQASIGVRDAQNELARVQKDGKSTADDIAKAQLGVESALLREVEAAGKLAGDALPASTDAHQKSAIAAEASLKELDKLAQMYGGKLPPNLQAYRDQLRGTVGDMDLGKVHADILGTGLDNLGKKKPTPKVDLDVVTANVKRGAMVASLDGLARMRPTPVAGLNTGPANVALASILNRVYNFERGNYTAHLRMSTYEAQSQMSAFIANNSNQTVYVRLRTVAALASGGAVDDHVTKAATGRIVGPGTSTSDSVPAIGPDGSAWALSNHEWIIKAAAAMGYGDAAMQAINDRRAIVTIPGQGTVTGGGGAPTNPSTGTGTVVRIDRIDIHLDGTFDFTDPRSLRQAAEKFRDEIRKIEMEYR